MSPRFLQACETFQPAEKACWEILLSEHSAARALPADELEAAMDQTLGQLWALLRTNSLESWLRRVPPLSPLGHSPEHCALDTFLPYFASGGRALDLVVGELERTHRELGTAERKIARHDLQAAFKVLVQSQLETICSSCQRGGTCRFGDRANPEHLKEWGPALPKRVTDGYGTADD